MRKFRILALVLALLVILPAVVACKKTGDDGNDTGDNTKEVVYQPVDPADAVEHKYYTSVYDMIGAKVTIDMVTENDDGTAKVTYEGKDYELGMDFLSMAMVYKTAVPENSQYETEDDVYAAWWKYYMTRWNYLRDGTSSFPKFRFTPTSISISTTLRSKTSRPLLTGVPRMLS